MNRKQIIGIIGGLLIVAGAFLPILQLPILGNVSFYDLNPSKTITIVAMGVLALAIAILNRHKFQLATSFVCFLIIGHTCFNLSDRIGEFSSLSSQNVAQVFQDINAIVHLSFGIPVIGIGALLLLYSAIRKTA